MKLLIIKLFCFNYSLHYYNPNANYNLSTNFGPPISNAALNISPILHFKVITSSYNFSKTSFELS